MNDRQANTIVRQRTRPNIIDFCFMTTRAHLKQFLAFVGMLQSQPQPIKVLDLGCGQKPFQKLLTGLQVEKYVGVDFDSERSQPDIIAPIDDLPLDDNSFDAVIATEVLEHTLNLEKAISEMRRVATNGALVYISTPFMFPEHGTPYDFQRITRYKYQELFKSDEIVRLRETNSSFATPFFLMNVAWENMAVLKYIPILPALIFTINNVFALLAEGGVGVISLLAHLVFPARRAWLKKLLHIYFWTMPGGFDLIVRIKK